MTKQLFWTKQSYLAQLRCALQFSWTTA